MEQSETIPQRRMASLFTPGTFVELEAERAGGTGNPDGDGIVCGWGRVDGQIVFAFAQDPSYLGGSLGRAGAAKVCRLLRLAREKRRPTIILAEGAGARIDEGLDALAGYTAVAREVVASSGTVPILSVVLGTSAGGPAYVACLTDWVLMTKDAHMFVTGPDIVKRVTGESVTKDELGGAALHARVSGSCHAVFDSEEAAIKAASKLLSYLPNAYDGPLPRVDISDPPTRPSDIKKFIPDDPRKPFNVKEVLAEILDRNSFFELHAEFARTMVVGFARLGGYPVGIVANQPAFGGFIDISSSRKAARFIQYCSSYSIPLLTFVDTPGFVSGAVHEKNGILTTGAELLHAFASSRSYKIGVCLRKAYGGAFSVMGSKSLGSALYFALPTAELGVMGAHGAYAIKSKKGISETEEAFIARYRREVTSPRLAVAQGHVDAIVEPNELRHLLFDALEMASDAPRAQSPRPCMPL